MIPPTAPAAVIAEFGSELALKNDWPVKQPEDLAPGECLVKIDYAGVCHSDLHIRNGDWSRDIALPKVGEHEAIGHIMAIGANSGTPEVKIGDRVGLKSFAAVCRNCECCRQGSESACSSPKLHGYTVDGTFTEYAVSYVDYVTLIPEGIESAAAAPILCAGLTIYKALLQTKPKAGNWSLSVERVEGWEYSTHRQWDYASSPSRRLTSADTGDAKRDLCLELGAEKFVDFATSTNVVQDVIDAAQGLGPHAAVIAAGQAEPLNQALLYLRKTGTLVTVGMASSTATVSLPHNLMIPKSLTWIGSAVGNRQDAIEALALAARARFDVTMKFVRKM
ncbi:GroES-like protein [Hymenopellis radicata]|nr:GroES-like protein [Hymenopellis radicata]